MRRGRLQIVTAVVLSLLIFAFSLPSAFAAADSGAGTAGVAPFYGVWYGASKDVYEMQEMADDLCRKGFDARVFVTTDWSELNQEFWYVVTAGVCATEGEAAGLLAQVAPYYPEAYVKYSGNYQGAVAIVTGGETASPAEPTFYYPSPFYGIWYGASKSRNEMEDFAAKMRAQGFDAQVFATTDWANLNQELWYVVTAGAYATEADAASHLAGVQAYYADAYIKYSGDYQGAGIPVEGANAAAPAASAAPAAPAVPTAYTPAPFFGIWYGASKSREEMEDFAAQMRTQGLDAQVFVTTDWSNLNTEPWYVVTAGTYATEADAYSYLPVVTAFYKDAYVKYSGDYLGAPIQPETDPVSGQAGEAPFYGIWCEGSKDLAATQLAAEEWKNKGFDAVVIVTTDWSNLNPEKWYVVTAGQYATQEDAMAALPSVQSIQPEAYVKYSGERQYQYQSSQRAMITVYTVDQIFRNDNRYFLTVMIGDKSTVLVLDENTVTDAALGKGNTLDWYGKSYDYVITHPTDMSIPDIIGAFDVAITGNHIDWIYGIYWWD